eukprot:gene7650-11971_t
MGKNSKEVNARHKKILDDLLKQPENKFCADCNEKGPLWASTNLGVFVCIKCSGVHRKMGTHISTVRSTTLDEWTPAQIKSIHSKGNALVNSTFEANLGKTSKITTQSDDRSRESYIRNKYEHKAFYGASNDDMKEFKKQVQKPKVEKQTSKTTTKPKVEKQKKVTEEPSMIDFGSNNNNNNNKKSSSLQDFVFDSKTNDGFPEPDEFEKQAMMKQTQVTQSNLLKYTQNDTDKKSNIMALFDEATLPAPMKPQIVNQPVYQQQQQQKPMMNPYQQQNKPMMYQQPRPMYGNQQQQQQQIQNKPMMYQQQRPMYGNQRPMYGNQQSQQQMMYQQRPMMGQQQGQQQYGNNFQQSNNFKF